MKILLREPYRTYGVLALEIVLFWAVWFAPVFIHADTITNGATLISQGTFPAATTWNITNIPAGYSQLLLELRGVSSDTASRRLQLLVSTDNGSSYKTTGYDGYRGADTTYFSTAALIGTSQTAAAVSTTTILISGYNNAYPAFWFGQYDGTLVQTGNSTYDGATSTVNALRISWDSTGSFDAGTYYLFGLGATTTSVSSGGSTTITSTTTTVLNPNQDLYNAIMLFFAVFFGTVWLLRKRQ